MYIEHHPFRPSSSTQSALPSTSSSVTQLAVPSSSGAPPASITPWVSPQLPQPTPVPNNRREAGISRYQRAPFTGVAPSPLGGLITGSTRPTQTQQTAAPRIAPQTGGSNLSQKLKIQGGQQGYHFEIVIFPYPVSEQASIILLLLIFFVHQQKGSRILS